MKGRAGVQEDSLSFLIEIDFVRTNLCMFNEQTKGSPTLKDFMRMEILIELNVVEGLPNNLKVFFHLIF